MRAIWSQSTEITHTVRGQSPIFTECGHLHPIPARVSAKMARIYSSANLAAANFVAYGCFSWLTAGTIFAQDNSGYYTDPVSGIVYRQVSRTVERPVVETKVQKEERTVFRPRTVTETKPETRTVFTPVVQHQWEPRLHGRWNPFRQPTVAYHHVPVARWETRSEVVTNTQSRTEWVAEKQTVEVPQRIVRIERDRQTDFEPVGRVAPAAVQPAVSQQIASRLRPLESNTAVQPLASATQTLPGNMTTFGSIGRFASDPPQRSIGQGGMRATELYRTSGHGQILQPSTGLGVAGLPTLWR